jgi:hypothetical protein
VDTEGCIRDVRQPGNAPVGQLPLMADDVEKTEKSTGADV